MTAGYALTNRATLNGDVIMVSNGVHTFTGPLYLGLGIAIRGATTNFNDTIIACGGTTYMLAMSHAGAAVDAPGDGRRSRRGIGKGRPRRDAFLRHAQRHGHGRRVDARDGL